MLWVKIQSHLYGDIKQFIRERVKTSDLNRRILLAYSKSFLAMLILIIRCILYPGSKLFVTSGGKEQAAGIMKEKVQELCTLIPALRKEIDWTRGKTLEGKDYAKYTFKNKSYFDNIAARESSRGKRRHANENFMTLFWTSLYNYLILFFIYNNNNKNKIRRMLFIMLGYIYTITNKINGKVYVGKTTNLKHRWEEHLSNLRNNKHHSIELQRSYNKYGEDNFLFEYEIVEVKNDNELNILEMNKIKELDSFNNGYNETLGGDGNKKIFDYEESVLLYQILLRYDGIKRYLGSKLNCDPTCFSAIENNAILYKNASYDEKALKDLIQKLNLSDKNLKENYTPHNTKKLTDEQCFELLAVIKYAKGYDKIMCEYFNIDSKLVYRLRKDLIYKNVCTAYNNLSLNEKEKFFNEMEQKYDLKNKAAQRQRIGVKNALTQEQINYILDNKNNKKRTEIAKELNISADRVSNVILGKSYKDLVTNYYNTHSF